MVGKVAISLSRWFYKKSWPFSKDVKLLIKNLSTQWKIEKKNQKIED